MFVRSAIRRLLLGSLFLLSAFSSRAQNPEFRGVWVDAWGNGFLNPTQTTQLINDCRRYNFNAVFVQMRRRGDAFYMPRSPNGDPRTTAIASTYDALADIIAKAHSGSPRIEVHCWAVANLIWSGTTPPTQAGHVFNSHPEYLMKNFAGQTAIGEGYYLDPGHPDAMSWNHRMAMDIVSRYDVDGFHWDYIRYPQADAGYNDVAIARFNAEFNRTGKPSSGDLNFSTWRRRQVTDFVRWVSADLLAIKPQLAISAAVFSSRSDAFNARFQDWAAWNREGIIDLCLPMDYSPDNTGVFNPRVDDAFNNQGVRRVYIGQGAYLNSKENTLTQLNYVRNKGLLGYLLYSYRVPNSGTVNQTDTFTHIKNNFQPAWVNPPVLPWKASPTKGIIKGLITAQGSSTGIYNATVTLRTSPTRVLRSEAHGAYAFFESPLGTQTITATAPGMGSVTGAVNVAAGQVATLNLIIPVSDSTAPVLSSVAATNISDTSATVVWTTDEPAYGSLRYGATSSLDQTRTNTSLATSHALILSGLNPATTYFYQVLSRDASGNLASSQILTFQTLSSGQVQDIIIDNPSATLSGTWTVATSATDRFGADYRYKGPGTGAAYAQFTPTILRSGLYEVFEWHSQGSNRGEDVRHVIAHQNGVATATVNQQINGGAWRSMGRFTFQQGSAGYVRITDQFTIGQVAIADAIKFVYVPAAPPQIVSQPQSLSVVAGASATFTVSVTGATPLQLQWLFNGVSIPSATNSSLTIANVRHTDAGEYTVRVQNSAGQALSSIALLTVLDPPSIVTHPRPATLLPGESVTLTVASTGTEPLQYQWFLNGNTLTGANEANLEIQNALPANSGDYAVRVSNPAGAATSAAAALLVTNVQAKVEGIARLDGQAWRLQIRAAPYRAYQIQISSNLTQWQDISTVYATNSLFEVIDSVPTPAPQRFYRVK